MRGTIKFVDPKTRLWGFIVPDDNGGDVHFQVSAFTDVRPTPADDGAAVEFDLVEDAQGRHAENGRLLSPPSTAPSQASSGDPAQALKEWAYVPFMPFSARDGKEYSSLLELLASKALEERWHFGDKPSPQNPFPVLDNYLTYTYFKLRREGRVLEHKSRATFNTGLVDRLYDPIYALFEKNSRGPQPWKFYDFCVPGKGSSGKMLTSVFDPLPDPPTYFSNNFDMLPDTTKEIHVDYEHVIGDGIASNRFPAEFIRQHVPRGITWQDPQSLGFEERNEFLCTFARALNEDVQCLRNIKWRLEDAKALAEKRTRWNFKTAIPQYYPRLDLMSLLLPLSLMESQRDTIALVVTRNPSGSYQGRTVLPLSWAYKNARLVCRPDSDWLKPQEIQPDDDQPSEQE